MTKSLSSYNMQKLLEDVVDYVKDEFTDNNILFEMVNINPIHNYISAQVEDLETLLSAVLKKACDKAKNNTLMLEFEEESPLPNHYYLNITIRNSGEGFAESDKSDIIRLFKGHNIDVSIDNEIEIGNIVSFEFPFFTESDEQRDSFERILVSKEATQDFGCIMDSLATTAPVLQEEEKESVLPFIPDITWDYGVMLSGDETVTLETAKEFYRTVPQQMMELKQLYEMVDTPEGMITYRIKVHGMKGAAAAFGGMQISALCRILEFAARAEDSNRIHTLHPILISELERILDEWSELKPEEEVKPLCEDMEWLKAKATEVNNAMVTLDIDIADAAIEAINEFSYDEELSDAIKEMAAAVANIDDAATMEAYIKILDMVTGGKA